MIANGIRFNGGIANVTGMRTHMEEASKLWLEACAHKDHHGDYDYSHIANMNIHAVEAFYSLCTFLNIDETAAEDFLADHDHSLETYEQFLLESKYPFKVVGD